MSMASDYLEKQLASHIFGSGSFSKPPTIVIALCSGTPIDSHTGATIPEMANTGAYARVALTPSADNWLDPIGTDGICYNHQAITFPKATSDWGWVSGAAIIDNASYGAGNMLIRAALTTPKLIQTNDRLILSSGDIQITIA